MRAFIAIELPPEIKESLANIQEQLKPSGADVKWVEPINIHLTLKFLGEIDDKKLDRIKAILDEVAKNKSSFEMRIASIGAFPKPNSPRVIWVGVDKGDKETKEVAKELEERIVKLGIPKENRPFSSHITIGRTRSPLNRDKLIQELNSLTNYFELKNREFRISKLTLFKSTLTPKGPSYEILKEANFISA